MKAEERRMAKIALSAFVHVEGANTRDCIHKHSIFFPTYK
jgi:hypothetical protein